MSNSETTVDKARKLAGILSDYVEKMPREIKFTMGDRIILHGLAVMENVVEAYYGSGQAKMEKINSVNTKLEILRQNHGSIKHPTASHFLVSPIIPHIVY
jgi:hypothetical protein